MVGLYTFTAGQPTEAESGPKKGRLRPSRYSKRLAIIPYEAISFESGADPLGYLQKDAILRAADSSPVLKPRGQKSALRERS